MNPGQVCTAEYLADIVVMTIRQDEISFIDYKGVYCRKGKSLEKYELKFGGMDGSINLGL